MSQKDNLISRQAAIDKFEPWLKVRGYSEGELNMLKAVLYELRFLPSVQPEILACGEGELNVPDTNVGDMIHRQAAIDAIFGRSHEIIKMRIGNLPSVQPEQRWIPCSERLPEEEDYKSCIECLDGAVWYFTENGTMGIGYYYESTKEWSTTDDLKTDGKVVAWMPLPEPYREERTEE